MKRIIAVLLSVSLLLGMTVISTAAAETDSPEIIYTQSELDWRELNMEDVPVVEVPGFGETIYRGLDTEDESDDTTVFGPSMDVLLPAIFKYVPGFLLGVLTRNYDLVDDNLGPFLLDVFSDVSCNPDGTMKEGTGGKYDNSLGLDENLEPIEPEEEEPESPEENFLSKISGFFNQMKDKINGFFEMIGNIIAPEEPETPPAEDVVEHTYGYRNSYYFRFDWRKDMHTLAGELHEYIRRVKKVTGSDKVAITAFSQGNCVVMTYLYEYYYTETDPEIRDDITSVVFICGAMNGVAACADPISGNIGIDSLSLLRFLKTALGENSATLGLYYMLEMLYAVGLFDWLVDIVNEYLATNLDAAVDPYLLETFGAIPGFFAMMSPERYKEAEEFLYGTPERQEKYAGLLEKNRYYHDEVQANMSNIIDSFMAEGKNVGIIAEYGYPMAPFTSDNDRMSDFSICTTDESFGATCSDVDGILGLDYKQAETCECGKNHVSVDLQIDASTCLYPDITWFGKGLKHDASSRFWGNLIDLILYSDAQISVWDYEDLPQFMENCNNEYLVPLTNDGTFEVPFESTLIFGKFRANGNTSF
ncbi:MAG: hypothetical protein IKL47_07660 [Clostridia bacterium]|nr:hypothetical protein [Clostridia bacterium]